MGSFVEDMKQALTNKSEEPVVDHSAAEKELATAAAPPQQEEQKPVEQKPTEPVKKYKIGDQEFDTAEAALEYAQVLEKEMSIQDAYRKGVVDATKPLELPIIEQKLEDKVSEMIWDNPKEAIRILSQEVEARTIQKIKSEQTAKQRQEEAWNNFYKANPDLSKVSSLVQMVTQQSWNEVANMDADKAFGEIAKRTRSMLKAYVEDSKPQTEMPNTQPTIPASSGNQQFSTTKIKTEEPVDFTSQINKLRKRGTTLNL